MGCTVLGGTDPLKKNGEKDTTFTATGWHSDTAKATAINILTKSYVTIIYHNRIKQRCLGGTVDSTR